MANYIAILEEYENSEVNHATMLRSNKMDPLEFLNKITNFLSTNPEGRVVIERENLCLKMASSCEGEIDGK